MSTYSHVQTSFAALSFPLGLNAPLDGAAAPALLAKGKEVVMIIRFILSMLARARLSREAANQVLKRAVNSLWDSLNVALGSGSDAESAMTWRSGEQDLQQPFALA
jgi:hypothetical protein